MLLSNDNSNFFEKIKCTFINYTSFINYKLDENIRELSLKPQNELIFSSTDSYTIVAIYIDSIYSKTIFKSFNQYLVGIYVINNTDYFFDKFGALNSALNSYLKYDEFIINRLRANENGQISIDNIFAKLALIKKNIKNLEMNIEQKILFSINVNTVRNKNLYIKKLLEVIRQDNSISYGLNSLEIINFLPSISIQKLEDIWFLSSNEQLLALDTLIFMGETFYSFLNYKIGLAYYNLNKFIVEIYDFINKTNNLKIKFQNKSNIKLKWNTIINLHAEIINIWDPQEITSYTNLDLLWKF
ncbi:hypothetical protein [Spiroplasma endosymbiont of Labia minor]|uniref:hypothetical protein n=1 Tax=Spiroplasma endosymbiont of Labia minor TaxID=3066305 RepID=UPI0030CE4749